MFSCKFLEYAVCVSSSRSSINKEEMGPKAGKPKFIFFLLTANGPRSPDSQERVKVQMFVPLEALHVPLYNNKTSSI